MRLSIAADRDDTRSAEVLAAALAAGVDLLDTADAYALDDADIGHNERLIGQAIAGTRVQVVTKGGLTRPGGAWVPDGRARHIAAAARASRDRLGGAAIALYLLHAVDPRAPLATSVRALARLRDDGIVRAIGLSNISLIQLERALAITAIDAVEVELHPWRLDAIRGGLVAACEARGIRVLAHRPLGGPAGCKRAGRDPVIAAHAARLAATPAELVLAWLRALSPAIVPLPGATRVDTATSAGRAAHLVVDDAARAALEAHLLATTGQRSGAAAPARGTPPSSSGAEVVLIVGMPASGKSTLATGYVARGYTRLDRDQRGGSLRELARTLDRELAAGPGRFVLDNTYPSRASRAPNAVARLLAHHGRLLEPAELARAGRADPQTLGPGAQFRFRRDYEPPRADEGFASIEEAAAPRATSGSRGALIVELDGLVWRGRPRTPDAIELVPGARDALAGRLRELGHDGSGLVAGTTWQPGLDPAALAALGGRLRELAGVPIELLACTHPAGPPTCWCRKPLPGLALAFAFAHDVDLARSVHLGHAPADRGFAARAGMPYVAGLG